jgi:hypothetical protein
MIMVDRYEIVPARQVIEEAIAINSQLGHENLGSLSYSHGFLPTREPMKRLPSSHQAWDQIAANIPFLFRTYAVRKVLNEMPLLSAGEDPGSKFQPGWMDPHRTYRLLT